jgi:hypothetical protein
VLQAERIAYSNNEIADAKIVGITQGHCREILRVFDSEHGYIRARVGADNDGIELPVVVQKNSDLIGSVNYVVIGKNVAFICINDDARACRADFSLALLTLGYAKEAAKKGILHERIVLRRHLCFGLDADDRWRRLFD